jgi:hypothetical protein
MTKANILTICAEGNNQTTTLCGFSKTWFSWSVKPLQEVFFEERLLDAEVIG